MRGFPMSSRDFGAALAQVELDDERSSIESKVAAGFEFVAIMDVGGEIHHNGEWRIITANTPRNFGDLRLIELDDGTTIKADRLAMRRYRPTVGVAS